MPWISKARLAVLDAQKQELENLRNTNRIDGEYIKVLERELRRTRVAKEKPA